MKSDAFARGGAPVAVLTKVDAWEANLIINMRMWCEGPDGQARVWTEFRRALPASEARAACKTFELLVLGVIDHATRPLVRREIGCACIGSDEAIFLNLVRTAADGQLADAALIATLLVGPAFAEQIALLAGDVGTSARIIHGTQPGFNQKFLPLTAQLH